MADFFAYDILIEMAKKEGSYDIDDLKEMFSPNIGSKRRLDKIKTIHDLIDCLVSRDELNEENVEPLRKLSIYNPKLHQALDTYQPIVQRRDVNQYQELRLADELQQQLHINPARARAAAPAPIAAEAPSPPAPQNYVTAVAFTEHKRAAIYKKISEELGRSWRELGRKVGISEGVMDDIEDRFPRDLKSRILRLLQLVEEDECHDPSQLLLRICRGLSEARRNDLRTKVEQIMSH